MDDDFKAILDEMASDSKEIRSIGTEKLIKLGNGDSQFFINLLDLGQEYSWVRNAAAYELRRIGDERAIIPLLNFILKPENINYNGSMVYALGAFDCSLHFMALQRILLYHGAEAKMGARSILSKQKFLFDRNDLLQLQAMWDECKNDPAYCRDCADWLELVEATVNSYLDYLQE